MCEIIQVPIFCVFTDFLSVIGRWKERNDYTEYVKYKKQVNKASKLLRISKRQFKEIADNIKSDSKLFYTYMRSRIRAKPTVGPLRDNEVTLVSNDKDMDSLDDGFFASVFTHEDTEHLPAAKMCFQGQDNDKLCSYSNTEDMMKSKLCKLKMNKAPGVGIRMLIELSEEISHTVA